MSLETLKYEVKIDGFVVAHFPSEVGKKELCMNYVKVDYDKNSIEFTIQKGPIKEVGVNGCQIDTLIETAKLIIEGLNKNFPSDYNAHAINHLSSALKCMKGRKAEREARGVEGYNEP